MRVLRGQKLGIPKEDLVLLLLAAPVGKPETGGDVHGITRLEKLLYLAQKELEPLKDAAEPFEFRPWKFGPFSQEVYDATDTLYNLDLISISEQDVASYPELSETETIEREVEDGRLDKPILEKVYRLTPRGERVVAALRDKEVPPALWDAICELKRRFGKLSLTRLIHYVYHTYPDSAVHTVLEHLKPDN